MNGRAALRNLLARLLAVLTAAVIIYVDPCVGELSDPSLPRFLDVATPGKFQDAIRAGIQHILITEHMNMTASPTENDMDNPVQALNGAIGRVKETTKSIGVSLLLPVEIVACLASAPSCLCLRPT